MTSPGRVRSSLLEAHGRRSPSGRGLVGAGLARLVGQSARGGAFCEWQWDALLPCHFPEVLRASQAARGVRGEHIPSWAGTATSHGSPQVPGAPPSHRTQNIQSHSPERPTPFRDRHPNSECLLDGQDGCPRRAGFNLRLHTTQGCLHWPFLRDFTYGG